MITDAQVELLRPLVAALIGNGSTVKNHGRHVFPDAWVGVFLLATGISDSDRAEATLLIQDIAAEAQ